MYSYFVLQLTRLNWSRDFSSVYEDNFTTLPTIATASQ